MAAPEMTTRIGVVLAEKYRVVRELGRGGVGAVYEVEHLRLRQPFAIKLLDPALAQSPEMIERFEREARAMASLKSPHIAQVTDVDVLVDGTPYIVMELLQGKDMGVALRERGSLPLREAIDIVLQACRGLELVHAAGIVHRDLKPANLFLVPSAVTTSGVLVKVMDFGISKIEGNEEVTRTGSSLGTPAYMSPEQVRSPRDVDTRTDLWSMGVILFRALAGALPFEGEGITGMSVAIVNNAPKSLRELRDGLPSSVLELVDRLLQKEREQRVGTIGELIAALEAIEAEIEGRALSQRPSAHTLPAGQELGPMIDSFVRVRASEPAPSTPPPTSGSAPPGTPPPSLAPATSPPPRTSRAPLVLAATAAALFTLVILAAVVLSMQHQPPSVTIVPATPTDTPTAAPTAPPASPSPVVAGPEATGATATASATPPSASAAPPAPRRTPAHRGAKPRAPGPPPAPAPAEPNDTLPTAAPAGSVPILL